MKDCQLQDSDPMKESVDPLNDSVDKTTNYKAWFAALIAALVVGLLVGFMLRAWVPAWVTGIVGIFGYLAGIVSLGFSNVFQKDKSLHYSDTWQRWSAIVAAIALGASAVTLIPIAWG